MTPLLREVIVACKHLSRAAPPPRESCLASHGNYEYIRVYGSLYIGITTYIKRTYQYQVFGGLFSGTHAHRDLLEARW